MQIPHANECDDALTNEVTSAHHAHWFSPTRAARGSVEKPLSGEATMQMRMIGLGRRGNELRALGIRYLDVETSAGVGSLH